MGRIHGVLLAASNTSFLLHSLAGLCYSARHPPRGRSCVLGNTASSLPSLPSTLSIFTLYPKLLPQWEKYPATPRNLFIFLPPFLDKPHPETELDTVGFLDMEASLCSLFLFYWKQSLVSMTLPELQRADSISSVQLISHVQPCNPNGLQHTRLPCPSPTSGDCSNSCPSSQ